jgi:hypothetical protein
VATTASPRTAPAAYPRDDIEVLASKDRASKAIPFRRLMVEGVVLLVLAVGGGLLFWGSSFAKNMVHDELVQQRITFPAKGSPALDPKEYPGLQRYAGQTVDNGPKAKAFANQYIAKHIADATGGRTYSELSTASRANPNDAQLKGLVETAFKGETLRGMLLNAWGWWTVGSVAAFAAWGAMAGAVIVLLAMVWSVLRPHKA